MQDITIRRAILSVWDKTGIVELAADLVNRGVELLSTGGSAAQQHAADALAHAMREPAAKAQIVTTVRESADAKELLAVLADSGNKGLAPQAVQLLESAEPGASRGKRKAELQRNGLAILFNRQKQVGWVVPSEEEEHGWSICPEWDRRDGGDVHEPQPGGEHGYKDVPHHYHDHGGQCVPWW